MNTLSIHAPAEIVVSDTEEFLSRDGITRKAGCTWSELPTLAIKELVDNGFDFPGASYEYDADADQYVIADEGPGLTKDDILRLFNIRRPMTSTKRWRRAGRGALGNGLRVACAAIRLLDGSMTVRSRDGEFRVTFDEIGETRLELIGDPREIGTEIRVRLAGDINEQILEDCTLAPGAIHTGPANAWAFGMTQFRELSRQCGRMTERQFAAQFGCDLGRDMPLAEIDDKGIKELHGRLKHRNPKNTELPGMGEDAMPHLYFGQADGMVDIGGGGIVPATVEAWAIATRGSGADVSVTGLWMNRTRSFTAPTGAYHSGGIHLRSCGLESGLPCKAGKAQYEIALAVTSSFFPMTSMGKAPDLKPFSDLIKKAVRRATKLAFENAEVSETEPRPKAMKPDKSQGITIKDAVFAVMDDAVRHASDEFTNICRVRQVFYSARSLIKDRFPAAGELTSDYFGAALLPLYMSENPTDHWPAISYDARGSASYPHTGEKNIQLSTVGVCNHTSLPPNLEKISAVLFVEKEQFGEIIGPIQDEFDLLLLEAKGQSTVAEKALMRWASDAGVPVFIFADCDIAGLQISEAIRNGTDRFPHPIDAKRIGLELDDALALDLLPEPYQPSRKHRTWMISADFPEKDRQFLLKQRFELNHLTTGQMRDLLRRKLTEAGIQKAMPTPERIRAEVRDRARASITHALTYELECEYRRKREELEGRIAGRVRAFADQVSDELDAEWLHAETRKSLQSNNFKHLPWLEVFDHVIQELKIISNPLNQA